MNPRVAIRQGQPTLGLDESLTRIPGVFVANRWNFSLDQRLSIRGFGSRANFGLRGVKVLLVGVPQTLPDGQSQLTNVEYASLERIEVPRGASSALYGKASGGALLLETESPGPEPVSAGASFEAGSQGSSKWTIRTTGRSGRASGSLAVSRFTTDGFRQQSAADIRQLAGMLQWDLGPGTAATFRLLAGDTPRAENPGALTAAEVAANPNSCDQYHLGLSESRNCKIQWCSADGDRYSGQSAQPERLRLVIRDCSRYHLRDRSEDQRRA